MTGTIAQIFTHISEYMCAGPMHGSKCSLSKFYTVHWSCIDVQAGMHVKICAAILTAFIWKGCIVHLCFPGVQVHVPMLYGTVDGGLRRSNLVNPILLHLKRGEQEAALFSCFFLSDKLQSNQWSLSIIIEENPIHLWGDFIIRHLYLQEDHG